MKWVGNVGRPREFDAVDALDKATALFRAKGYFDASIRDLVERTGVNYYGLYAEFESKHGLFLAALDRYRETVTADVLGELKGSGPARARIERALARLHALMKTEDGSVGCLMAQTATELGPSDETAAAKVDAHRALLQKTFRVALAKGQATGDVDADKNIDALAEFLTTTAYSIGLLVRAGQNDAYVRRHIRTALQVLD